MKKMLHRSLSCLLALMLTVSLAIPALATNVHVTGITLNKTSVTLAVDEHITLDATVTPSDASDQDVTWGSNKTSVATVSNRGKVTAVSEGTATITATTADGGYQATCSVTVEGNYVTGVTITPTGPETIPVGRTRQLSAKVLYAHDTKSGSQDVTWSSSAPQVASVSDNGVVTTLTEGSASIMAMAKEKGRNGTLVFQMYELTVAKAGGSSSGDVLTLSSSNQTWCGGKLMDTYLRAPTATVKNGTKDVTDAYTLTYAWVGESNEALGTGQTQLIRPLTMTDTRATCTITAVSKTDSTRRLTGTCSYTVKVLPGTVVGAAVKESAGAVTLDKLMDLDGKRSVVSQLTQGGSEISQTPLIPGLTHVIFNLDSISGGEVGTLSARAEVPYYINANSSGNLLSQVSFTPAKAGTYRIEFVAYGDTSYYGQLEIVVSADSTSVTPPPTGDTLTCDSAGLAFTGSTFFHPTDTDPVASMTFGNPSSGLLLRDFKNGSGGRDEGAQYYTDSAANGDYHVSTLTYLPKAGFSGLVTIPVTYTTQSGQKSTQTLSIQVTKKTASAKFTDVTADTVGSWAADAIDFAYTCGLVSGVDSTRFAPNTSMTRAMLVTVLYRAAGSPEITVTTNFTDLNVGDYYYNAVVWANMMGVVNGTSDTTFSPNTPITREQIATILYRFADIMEQGNAYEGTLNAFTDKDKVSTYAVVPMTWAVSHGIISGTTGNTLSPRSATTRAQVAVMLHRYLAE